MDRVHYGSVNDSGTVLTMDLPVVYAQALRALAGQPVEVIVRKVRRQRTTRANRFYWGVVLKELGNYCGYHPDEMHEVLALRYLRIEDDPFTGSPRRKRTPDTDTREFAEYVDRCIQFAAELGVVIPEPGRVEAA